jgi:hypothetical protein
MTLRDRLVKNTEALLFIIESYRSLVVLMGREDLEVHLDRARDKFEKVRMQLASELPVDERLLASGMGDLEEFERLLSHRE